MKIMPWFKWWDGTAADPKFRMLAENVKIPVASVLGVWAYLLEKASAASDRGMVPEDLDVPLMAYTLQMEPFAIETVRNALKRYGLVTETGEIVQWEKRQAKRDNGELPGASTARVQRLRARQKASQNKDLDGSGDGNGNVTGVTAETTGNDPQRPKKKKESREEKKPKTTSPAGADGFDLFWQAYPRKVGKQDAAKAWAKLKPNADLQRTILSAIEAQLEGDAWKRDDGQYVPHPTTWINGGRWLDEVRPYVAPPLKLPPGWWDSKEGMEAAGLMLTPPLKPRQGEYPKDFVARIRVALGQIDAAPATAAPTLEAYIPPAPPADVILTDEQRAARRQEFKDTMAQLRQTAGLPKQPTTTD